MKIKVKEMNKKHYLIYQITNTVNNKIYIGKHITENVDDDYFGSGKYLKRAQKKYGLDKFVKTILFECQNKEEMDLLEKCVVTKEFCDRDDTYNINVGGDGGWNYVNNSFIIKSNANKVRWKNMSKDKYLELKHKLSQCNKEYCHTKEFSTAVSIGLKKTYILNPEKRGMLGKHLSEASKRKIAKAMRNPVKNKMIGKCWIHNIKTLEFKVWPKEKELPDGWAFGKKPHKEVIPKNPNHPNLGYLWISKGNEHKYVLKSEIDIWINSGWHKGRK